MPSTENIFLTAKVLTVLCVSTSFVIVCVVSIGILCYEILNVEVLEKMRARKRRDRAVASRTKAKISSVATPDRQHDMEAHKFREREKTIRQNRTLVTAIKGIVPHAQHQHHQHHQLQTDQPIIVINTHSCLHTQHRQYWLFKQRFKESVSQPACWKGRSAEHQKIPHE